MLAPGDYSQWLKSPGANRDSDALLYQFGRLRTLYQNLGESKCISPVGIYIIFIDRLK